ncbi:MAG: hypothetical protein ACE5E6_13125, partial [Phycisphaerae bacterium]
VYAFRKDAADDAGFLRDIRRCLARFGRRHVVDAEAPRGEPAGRGGVAAPGGVHAARSGGSAATRFALAGPAVFRAALNEATQRRLSVIMMLIVLTGGLLLWWITGQPSTAAAAMAAIVLSQIMLMGLVGWSGVAVDMSLSMVPPLMMALGFSYAAHHALRPGTGGVLVLCLATTALGIGGFAASGLPAVRTFAVYGVLGLVLVWLAVVMLVPIPAPRGRAPARRDVWLRRARGHTLAGIRRRGHAVTIIAVGVTVAAVAAIPRLRLGMNPLNYFSRSARIVRDADVLNRRLTGTLPFEVVVSRGDPTPVLMRTPGIRKVIDVTRLTPGAGDTYWVLADADALPGIVAHRDAWRRWADTAGATLSWRGVAAAIHAAGRGLRTVAAITIPMMVLIAAAVVGVMTRSLRQAGISAWVNLLPVAGLIIAMAVTGRPIELPSLMIGAISVGVAVDDTIHLTWVLARSRSVAHAMVTCWRPCVGSSLVAAWCMALFVLAPFGPTRQFEQKSDQQRGEPAGERWQRGPGLRETAAARSALPPHGGGRRRLGGLRS